ncbi:hypothetical protein NP493_2462g00000 [Ridgeia piscesae]|uniref:Kringle domain-containing protein n=1 Tax=Ridgeia piscesae TaxID=27915 RepID=A0AAD9N310_RIDPI|nr:hypothetical protein NP493_2462g00000 [Ridgeia piscesae]
MLESCHPCRFDSSSASRGSCIFPCRCTDGCDQVTGQCVDGGTCSDGQPRGYKWSGEACQIGNVAFNKNANQSPGQQSASKAVDGITLTQEYDHCTVLSGTPGTQSWWMVDFGGNYQISRVIIYHTACKAGYFGWRCRFRCHKCPTCDAITGKCPSTCQDNRWGVGCMLSSDCYYDNEKGERYMGRKSKGYISGGRKCISWTWQTRYPDSWFPDGSRSAAGKYCRNVGGADRPWCYYNTNYNWVYCRVDRCPCDSGRFGVNCEKECHCNDENENCQNNSPKGRCNSGCAPHFTGSTCQECEDGHFGVFCDGTCHCSSGSCDKTTGHCPSGCATGWSGDNCQTGSQQPSAFTLSVGNSSDVNDHTQCASHNGAVAAGATVNESCTATGRYLSFSVKGEAENPLTTLCEVVVIGHKYISCQRCPSTSSCDDVIGCDACEQGKKQPDCTQGHDNSRNSSAAAMGKRRIRQVEGATGSRSPTPAYRRFIRICMRGA